MAIDILAFLLKAIGIFRLPCYGHYGLRLFLCSMDILACVYMVHVSFIIIFESGGAESEMTYLMYTAYVSDFVYCTLVYIWGIRFAKRYKREFRDTTLLRWAYVNLGLMAIVDVTLGYSLVNYLTSAGVMDFYFCPICLGMMEFYYAVIMKLQCYSVCLLVSGNLLLIAKDLSAITSKLSISNFHESCEKIREINAHINDELHLFLVLFHVQYFVRLVGEIPSLAMSFQCGEGLYMVLENLGQLHVFLIVVHSCDLIEKRIQQFRRKILYFMVANRSDYLECFLRQTFGLEVDVGFSSVLSWNTCFSFLSFCWSFAFMTFQFAVVSKPWTCY